MNDKIIPNIIRKIHFKLLLFFVLLFFTVFLFFVALIEGFTISHLKLGDIVAEQVYLKWDNRLHVKASLIDLSKLKSDDDPITLKPLQHFPRLIKYTEAWVESIHISTLRYRETNIKLHYIKGTQGWIDVQKGNIKASGTFLLTQKFLQLTLLSPDLALHKLSGKLFLDIEKQSFEFNTTLQLPNTPTLTMNSHGDQERFFLNISAKNSFNSLTELINFINLDPTIRPWILNAAHFETATLHSCTGEFLYDHPEELLTSLNVHATLKSAHYTFDPALSPIKAKIVDLYFQKGKLHIQPHEGTFYTLPTQNSRLFIDFTTPHVMLQAFINSTQGQLNNDILNLLTHYDIVVPVRQNSGISNVDLNLSINLYSFDTYAKGRFIPSPSEIELDGFIFTTTGGIVTLDGTKVVFNGFDAVYKEIARAKVKGDFDASTSVGQVNITPYKFYPTTNSAQCSLINPLESTRITYHIHPRQDWIEITPSSWDFFGKTLLVGKMNIPFDFKKRAATLSKIPFSIPNISLGLLSGNFLAGIWDASLQINSLKMENSKLLKAPFSINISPSNKGIILASKESSLWSFDNQEITFSPFEIISNENSILFDNLKVLLKDQLSTTLSGEYSQQKHEGTLKLKETTPINPLIARAINTNETQNLTFNTSNNGIVIHSNGLGITLRDIVNGWKLEIPDISFLSSISPLLSYYEITKGKLNLYYNPLTKHTTFDGSVDYPYAIMMLNNKSLSTYRFSGSNHEGKTFLKVNDRITINADETINLRASNMGINGKELLRWLSTRQSNNHTASLSTQATIKPIQLRTDNVFFYLMENRKILSDTLIAKIDNDHLDARLTHGRGVAEIKMKDQFFYVEGSGFNDRFMSNLFALSEFEEGRLSFKISGKAEKFEGVVRIDETTLKEYIILNNLLSFINTIPSLATFSLPNYSTKGLEVKETYAHFSYENHLFTLDNYTLDSPELKMHGYSRANVIEDTIKGTLTLKTDLGSALGRVPMVGYILLGDDRSISTTVELTGKLSNPTVETAIAKEIVSAPFNILKRAISYPFLWMVEEEKKE